MLATDHLPFLELFGEGTWRSRPKTISGRPAGSNRPDFPERSSVLIIRPVILVGSGVSESSNSVGAMSEREILRSSGLSAAGWLYSALYRSQLFCDRDASLWNIIITWHKHRSSRRSPGIRRRWGVILCTPQCALRSSPLSSPPSLSAPLARNPQPSSTANP